MTVALNFARSEISVSAARLAAIRTGGSSKPEMPQAIESTIVRLMARTSESLRFASENECT
jgi:hypothetical protein